jgi:competence protein ComEC
VLIALPAYALLAGAAPSAVRAAVMGMIYVGARLLGRALIPMAAVLLTGVIMLLGSPDLLVDAGFQLTILITAALVRWVPPVVDRIPGPRWIIGALAVPVVAQIAAAPIVAWHFRTAVPGAVVANLMVPPLLAPTLIASLASAATSPVSATVAGWLLDAVALCEHALWACGAAGRALQLTLPALPALAIALLTGSGWLALRPDRKAARAGVAGWLVISVAVAGWCWLRPPPEPPRVELLPVADGLSALVIETEGALLVDGGRFIDEAAQQITGLGVGRLSAVVATHTDEDHASGLRRALESRRVDSLVIPVWMQSEPSAVPLLRTARQRHALIVPVARGVSLGLGGTSMEVLWPPAVDPPLAENERSLVARLQTSGGAVLVTSDIGTATEVLLARAGSLACRVLVAPHHGSRGSTSTALLVASDPDVVLIPAGPRNVHNHPHPEVLARLDALHLPYRFPARDGACGARFADGEWLLFP